MRKQSKSQSAKSTKCPVRSPKSPSFRSPTPNRWTADHRHPRSSYPPHHTESPCSTNCTFPRPNTSADWLRFIPIQRIRTVQFPQNPKNVLDVLIVRNQQRKLQRHQPTNNPFPRFYTSVSFAITLSGSTPNSTSSSSKIVSNASLSMLRRLQKAATFRRRDLAELIEFIRNQQAIRADHLPILFIHVLRSIH